MSVAMKIIRVTNCVVNLFVLTIIFLLLVFGSYAIWDSNQIYSVASAGNYEIYRPSVESETTSFADLQIINPDVFSWLTVYGTNIDYPVVQGQDNIRYVNTDVKGRYSLSGAIFLDSRNSPNFSDFSNIVYGHHMEKKAMFGEIELFADRSYFDARRYGMLYFDGQEHGLEFFAFIHADAYDTTIFRAGITEAEDKQGYLDMLLQEASHIRTDMSVTMDDQIVLLATCSSDSTNGRDILIGKITSEVQSDSFRTETVKNVNPIQMIDRLPYLWSGLGLWIQIAIVALASLLIVLAIVLIYTKRQRR